MSERFSVYHVPNPKTTLYQLGSAILGRCIHTGGALQPPWSNQVFSKIPPHPARAATYGFHATMVAPFRTLVSVETLTATLQTLAAKSQAIDLGPLEITLMEPGFPALTPKNAPKALYQLEEGLVKTFAPLAKPIEPDDLARREPLTDRQRALAKKWGYPYVLDEFRYHLTLGDNLAENPQGPTLERITFLDLIHSVLDDQITSPLPLDSLCLCRQGLTGGPFTVIFTANLQVDPKTRPLDLGHSLKFDHDQNFSPDRHNNPMRGGLSGNYLHELK
ncbi:MAG: DUF1045 domain-containing protein [Deltaproteobacteria bacterium]|jgi:hypothetical protein|nr:DUF1045 domain-containing protein [Deltaproteobacteria bacterium]